MRLTADEVATIKALVGAHLDPSAEVRLFGSRADDRARGGDIDLVVTVDRLPSLEAELRLKGALEHALDDQRVDLLLQGRDRPARAMVQAAYRHGVVL